MLASEKHLSGQQVAYDAIKNYQWGFMIANVEF